MRMRIRTSYCACAPRLRPYTHEPDKLRRISEIRSRDEAILSRGCVSQAPYTDIADMKWFVVKNGCSESWRLMVPHSSNWMDDLAGSRQQDRGGPSKTLKSCSSVVV